MPKNKDLLIVESPTKARTIARLLGEKMTVLSSKGHIIDLPKSKLGVDLENNFEPSYVKIRGKESVIRELKAAAGKAGVIYIGSDPDREGEAIAHFIAQAIDGNAARRVRFHEITTGGLKQAFAKPTVIDLNMVDSQKARRVLDRLVGYLASPLLWRVFTNSSLSAGRVQSVALRLICEREKEILAFKPEEFWIIDCDLKTAHDERFIARLVKCEGEDCRIGSEAEATRIRQELESAPSLVTAAVKVVERVRNPNPPFITSTLQQEAARNYHFPGRLTMRIAQQLFEGITLGEEAVGLITYPRTDAVRVNHDMIQAARDEIVRRFGCAQDRHIGPGEFPDVALRLQRVPAEAVILVDHYRAQGTGLDGRGHALKLGPIERCAAYRRVGVDPDGLAGPFRLAGDKLAAAPLLNFGCEVAVLVVA